MSDSSTPPDQLKRLSRDMLADGTVYKMATERDGDASTVLTMEELQASRQQFLDGSYAGGDIWIFGYGSLIWNPLIDFEERRYGQLFGGKPFAASSKNSRNNSYSFNIINNCRTSI